MSFLFSFCSSECFYETRFPFTIATAEQNQSPKTLCAPDDDVPMAQGGLFSFGCFRAKKRRRSISRCNCLASRVFLQQRGAGGMSLAWCFCDILLSAVSLVSLVVTYTLDYTISTLDGWAARGFLCMGIEMQDSCSSYVLVLVQSKPSNLNQRLLMGSEGECDEVIQHRSTLVRKAT